MNIFTYTKDYKDGFKAAYILGPTGALAQIHRWDTDEETPPPPLHRDILFEFLSSVEIEFEPDGDIDANGMVKDCSRYIIYCRPDDMDLLAAALDIKIKREQTAWEAIEEYMSNDGKETTELEKDYKDAEAHEGEGTADTTAESEDANKMG